MALRLMLNVCSFCWLVGWLVGWLVVGGENERQENKSMNIQHLSMMEYLYHDGILVPLQCCKSQANIMLDASSIVV
jgi:hypothetical protein